MRLSVYSHVLQFKTAVIDLGTKNQESGWRTPLQCVQMSVTLTPKEYIRIWREQLNDNFHSNSKLKSHLYQDCVSFKLNVTYSFLALGLGFENSPCVS